MKQRLLDLAAQKLNNKISMHPLYLFYYRNSKLTKGNIPKGERDSSLGALETVIILRRSKDIIKVIMNQP